MSRKTVHKLLAVLLCVVLLYGAIGTASGSSNVYFMAVNDTVVEMTADNMPIVVGGTLYVPYIMLSSRDTGINLGVTAQYSTTRRTVLVSGGRLGVIFNPQNNTCHDLNGEPVQARAVVRNSMIYLPLAWVCEYFGTISYTTTRTDYGTLVRVTNSAVILTDAEFVDAATSMLRDNYYDYLNSLGGAGNQQPGGDVPPSGRPESGPVVYLAFRMGEQAEAVAQLLENNMQRGLFLLTTEQMAQQDEMVRRLVGAGHMVGLRVQGGTAEACAIQIREGRRLLADIARTALTIISAPEADEKLKAELERQGCALWRATVSTNGMAVNGLLPALSADQANYVECACDEQTLNVLSHNMGALAGTDYRLRQAVAPAL